MKPNSLQPIDKTEIKKVADFVLKYGPNLYQESHRTIIESFLETHMGYGTLLVVRAKGEIVGACRWNWLNQDTVKVLDLIIHPAHRNKRTMKSMLVHALKAYPWVKYMKFCRKKYSYRESTYMVNDFIGGKHGR